MDRKSILVLVASFALMMAWFPLVNRIWPPKPLPPQTNQVGRASSRLPVSTNTAPNAILEAAATNVFASAVATPTSADKTVVLESDLLRYTFTSQGGGVKYVELKKYPAEVDGKSTVGPEFIQLNGKTSPTLFAFTGAPEITGDGQYLLRQQRGSVVAEKLLPSGLKIVKTFTPATNYLMQVVVRLENTLNTPLAVPSLETIAGAATPLNAIDNELLLGAYHYDGSSRHDVSGSIFSGGGCSCNFSGPVAVYESPAAAVHWTAMHNQFFTIATIPQQPANRFLVRRIELAPPTALERQRYPNALPTPHALVGSLYYPSLVLAAQSTNNFVERSFTVYTGPKEYHLLAKLGAEMNNKLDLIMNFDGFFGFFAKALLLSMNWLHDNFKLSYALAIIAITVIFKLVFWPLTNASTKSMKRMAALQPQMKAIQDKYKDEPAKMNQKVMEFMKENKVSPLGGCLPMVIQIPVFFGFYKMIQTAIELRGASFLWATDLSQADTVAHVAGFPINPLPLVMGVTMLWQARLTPPSPGMDPMQQKIMKYMPLMFMVFLYNMSAGLTLYWTVQNLLTIAQMQLTKAAPVGSVTVIAPPVKARKAK